MGELPEQQQANLQILSGLQAQLYAASGALAVRISSASIRSRSSRSISRRRRDAGRDGSAKNDFTRAYGGRDAIGAGPPRVRRRQDAVTDKNPIVVALKEQVEYWKGRISDMDKQAEAAEAAPESVSKTAPVDTDLRLDRYREPAEVCDGRRSPPIERMKKASGSASKIFNRELI